MSTQTPQQCKDPNASSWMYNDQGNTPCQLLSSSLTQFEPSYNLTWLDLSFACPLVPGSAQSNRTRQLSEFCCSSVSFSLFSSCWACQWDQPVQGYVRTTWNDYSSTCLTNTTNQTGTVLAAARIGTLSAAVQSALTAANIRLPSWLFLPVTGGSTWDEAAAKANATASIPVAQSASESEHLSKGAIAGISIGSFIFFCILVFAFTVVCMRKKQRHRLEAFRHRSASIFGHHKKRVVNMGEKTGSGGTHLGRGIGSRGIGIGNSRANQGRRMDLAALEDDTLASPVSAKGVQPVGFGGTRRVNSDLTMDISHEAMLPSLVGQQQQMLGAPATGVAGVPDRQRSSGSGMASRLSNVRKSLARLGRRSQPEQQRTGSPAEMPSRENRHTHPMTVDETNNFAVPFSSSDQQHQHQARHAPSSWPMDTHPLTQQQLHPQLARNPSGPSTGHSSLPLTNDKPTPMPLTKEALALARVAQDGTLFVMGEPEVKRTGGKVRGAPTNARGSPGQVAPPQPSPREYLVRTVSIERNPSQMQRHVEMTPRRSDSLRRNEMLAVQAQQPPTPGQLVLHESLMDGSVPRRKTPRQRDEGELGTLPSAPRPPPPPTVQKPTLVAPVARKPVPKSDSSVKANAGSAVGSNGEGLADDDESVAALEIRHITGSATGTTSGSSGNGRNAAGGGKGKKRAWGSDDVRMSVASGGAFGIKSDGTRTPSPKVAPSAEWFDLFRRGTVPTFSTTWEESKAELTRNKTAPVSGPPAPVKKPAAFQPNAMAGPSGMASYERTRTQSSTVAEQAASFYRTPIAALYSSTSSLNAVGGGTEHTVRRQMSEQNLVERAAPASQPVSGPARPEPVSTRPPVLRPEPTFTNPQLVTRPEPAFTNPQPVSAPRALPPVSIPQTRQLPSINTQPNQMAFAPSTNQTTSPASHPYPQRTHPSIPLPTPPTAQATASSSPTRVAPAGGRPVRRLPAIPPQSPSP